MVTELVTPRMARWILRACVLVGAAVWWLLAQSTGAFADDDTPAPPTTDSALGAATDAVADVAEATARGATDVVRDAAAQPAVKQVLPHVTEAALSGAADHVDSTSASVNDTVRDVGHTVASSTSSALPAAPDAPSGDAPTGATGSTAPQPSAPAPAPAHAPASSPGHRHEGSAAEPTGGARDESKARHLGHRAPAHDAAARLLSHHAVGDHQQEPATPPATADRSGLDEWPAGAPLGSADDAGHTAQGAGASGAAASTPASSAIAPHLNMAGRALPASCLIPASRTDEPGSTPD
jgi:hypothetical protein